MATADRASTLDLGTLHLDKGSHSNRTQGVCLLEAVAWYSGLEHSDAPPCVSPVLRTFGTNLNDLLPDERRQTLRPLIPALVGTAGDGWDETRSYVALDWLIRTYTPAWLDLARLTGEATALRDLRRIVDSAAAQAAGSVVRAARTKAAAAWAAAGDAARDAGDAARDAWDAARAAAGAAARDAGDAARAAAWAAAGAAARDAARDAAGAVAWAAARDAGDAARAAAWAAAGDAARDAAGDAAGAAAWAAARDAGDAGDAGDAARAAAGDALQPTVDALQISAIHLYRAMIRPDQSWKDATGGND